MLHIEGGLQAVSIVTNTWHQSTRFYTEGLGYRVLEGGHLSDNQRKAFGAQLGKYALLGHEEGSVIRLIETSDSEAMPNRMGAKPWDNGLGVVEAGTPNVDAAYWKVLRARFGAIVPPLQFDCEGPEPLGYVLMKSTAFIGPSGEQVFVTQIVGRKGGVSLLKEKAVEGINAPANAVISLKNREQQQWYANVLGLVPVNDLPLHQNNAAAIMGGPQGMGFDMCLMGAGMQRVGMEQHVYEPHNEGFEYKVYPCSFAKTGIASAAWLGNNLAACQEKLLAQKVEFISEIGLPIRNYPEPKALVFRGIVGEIIELIA